MSRFFKINVFLLMFFVSVSHLGFSQTDGEWQWLQGGGSSYSYSPPGVNQINDRASKPVVHNGNLITSVGAFVMPIFNDSTYDTGASLTNNLFTAELNCDGSLKYVEQGSVPFGFPIGAFFYRFTTILYYPTGGGIVPNIALEKIDTATREIIWSKPLNGPADTLVRTGGGGAILWPQNGSEDIYMVNYADSGQVRPGIVMPADGYFVCSFDTAGNMTNFIPFGSGNLKINGLAVDDDKNVYLSTYTTESGGVLDSFFTILPNQLTDTVYSSGNFPSTVHGSPMLLKFDSIGNLQWYLYDTTFNTWNFSFGEIEIKNNAIYSSGQVGNGITDVFGGDTITNIPSWWNLPSFFKFGLDGTPLWMKYPSFDPAIYSNSYYIDLHDYKDGFLLQFFARSGLILDGDTIELEDFDGSIVNASDPGFIFLDTAGNYIHHEILFEYNSFNGSGEYQLTTDEIGNVYMVGASRGNIEAYNHNDDNTIDTLRYDHIGGGSDVFWAKWGYDQCVICDSAVAQFNIQIDTFDISITNSSEFADNSSWYINNALVSTDIDLQYTFADTGNYEICLIVGNNCDADTICQIINISCSFPQVFFNAQQDGLTISLQDNSQSVDEYIIDWGDGIVDSLLTNHSYSNDGQYTICVQGLNFCGMDSACFTIDIMTGIRQIWQGDYEITLTPNPAKEQVAISYNNLPEGNKQLLLVNMLGQVQEQQQILDDTGTSHIDVFSYASGVYIVHLMVDDKTISQQKLVVE